MMGMGLLEAARPNRRSRFGTGVRILGLLVLGGSAASATALIYPAPRPSVDVVRVSARAEKAPIAAAPVSTKVADKLTLVAPVASQEAALAPAASAVRQIPLISGVDPTPPTPPKVTSAPQQVASSASLPVSSNQPIAAQGAVAASSVIAASAKAPMDCLPEGLRTVLQDVQARFGTVTLVSTRELHTDNHSAGSTRHKMHTNCKAVDFKVEGDLNAVTAYLRARPEVSGVNSYRNNRVIHIDAAEGRKLAQR